MRSMASCGGRSSEKISPQATMSYSLRPTPHDSLVLHGYERPNIRPSLAAARVGARSPHSTPNNEVELPTRRWRGACGLDSMHTIMVRAASQPKIAFWFSLGPVVIAHPAYIGSAGYHWAFVPFRRTCRYVHMYALYSAIILVTVAQHRGSKDSVILVRKTSGRGR